MPDFSSVLLLLLLELSYLQGKVTVLIKINNVVCNNYHSAGDGNGSYVEVPQNSVVKV